MGRKALTWLFPCLSVLLSLVLLIGYFFACRLWFVLCLVLCLGYDSAIWAQTAATDQAAATDGLFLQPLTHKAISHPSGEGLDLSPDPH